MHLSRNRTTARAAAALIALIAAIPGASAMAAVHTKSCAHIDRCATTVSPPAPPPTAIHGQPATPTSRYELTVRTPPFASPTTSQQKGNLITNAQLGRKISCRGYHLRAPSTFQFMLQTATPADITYDITEKITNTTSQGIHFCLAANFAFRTMSGGQARSAVLPDKTRGHVGLLPRCRRPLPPPGAAPAPCIAEITTTKDSASSTGVDVTIRVRVPTRTKGDPWGGG
jgi:hypothetical protein